MKCSNTFLTLCMIVKNEEDNLPRSLASVKGVVDEIVVVDTGSQDKTVEIAREYGAKVYSFSWQNDFALARNYALDQAQGEWILFLDADEELKKTKINLRQFLQKTTKEGFLLKLVNIEDNQNILNSYAFRLFRNNPLYRYEGKIHEQILPVIERINSSASFEWLDLEIYHYGYLSTQVKAKNKQDRNLQILLSEEPEVKETSFYCFNLGMEYLRRREFIEAEKWLKDGWEKVDTKISFAHRLLSKLIICLFLQKKYQEAIFYCQKGEEYYSDYADLYYYQGLCFMELGQLGEARKALLIGLEKGESSKHYISEEGCGSYRNFEALGMIEEAHLNFDLATNYFLEVFKFHPQDSYYLKLVLRNLVKTNVNTIEYLRNLTFCTKEILHVGGEFLFNLGKYNLVNDLLAFINNSDSPSQMLLQAKTLLMLGKLNKAQKLLEQIPANLNLKKEAVFYTWIIAWLKADSTLAARYLEEMDFLDSELANLLVQLQKYLIFGEWEKCQIEGLNQERNINLLLIIIEAFAAVLGSAHFLERVINFTKKIGDEGILIVIAKILYKQKLYTQSLEMLKKLDLEVLDVEAALALVELVGETKPLVAVEILNILKKQNPSLARTYLMGIDIWLKAVSKVNEQIEKKVFKFKKVPALC